MDCQGLLDKINGDNKDEGWAAVQELLNLRPSNDEEKKARAYACACMAESLFARDKIGTAIDWWQECVDNDPLNPTYRLAFVARGLLPAGMKAQAFNECERALNLDKKSAQGWRLLAHCQLALNDVDGAIKSFDKHMELEPESPVPYLDRADLALELADWNTVAILTQASIAIPGEHYGNVLHQIGLLAMRQGKYEEALKVWDETVAAGCDNPEIVAWNQSIALLALGRYREGWRKHESRGVQKRDIVMAIQMHRSMPERLWNNEPPPQRLHIHQEQGYGDAICMARYLPILAERGYDVRYEVMPQLVDLLQYSMPEIKVMPRAPIFPGLLGVPEFDYHLPCLSLPRLFGTEVKSIPWNGPFLKANPEKVKEYRAKLDGATTVGFCWSAGVRTGQGLWLEEYGKRKSMEWADMQPIAEAFLGKLPHTAAVSLQVGSEAKGGRFMNLLPKNPTWADTAALVECMDLVITVDTGLAHLVGGMGKPLWLLMHTEGSWHWMVERPGAPWNEKSPWYPTARLFRQKKPHEWGEVIQRVTEEIGRHFDIRADVRRVG